MHNMDFQLIDQELSEARLFRGTRKFSTLDGKDIANLLYLNTISLFIFSSDNKQSGYARDYARASTQYSTYSLFRTHATDIYMLAYQIKNPSNDYVKMRNEIPSKAFLNRLSFQDRKHIEFLRKIVIGKADPSEAQSYLFRLEAQLDINDGRYKRWRRMALEWKRLKDIQKSLLLHQIGQEMSRLGKSTGRTSELLITFNKMYKYRKYTNSAEKKDVIRRVSPPSVQPDKKRAGGIKRIADYWASRTKK